MYDAQAAVRSALAMWVGVVRERAKASVKYNYEHTKACAEVLPILDQIVRDADKIGFDAVWRRRLKSVKGYVPSPDSTHWTDHVYVPPLGSGYLQLESQMDSGFTMLGYSYKRYGERIEEIKKRIYGYPWLVSWLRG